MQIQVHSDNHIDGSARLADWVSASVTSKVARYDDNLTRVVVHLNDENAHKAGANDKRCQIEARPKGQAPVSVTHKADSLETALDGALEKLEHALEHQMGKRRSRRPATPYATPSISAEAELMLEEDFLADEQIRQA